MAVDLFSTLDEDLSVDPNGDIKDTSYDSLRALFQEIRKRCRSSFKDWALKKNLGANINDLLGNPNNRITAEEGKSRLIAALTQGGFLTRNVIKIRYMPLGIHRLVYNIGVTVTDPVTGTTKLLKVQLLYDTTEDGLTVV